MKKFYRAKVIDNNSSDKDGKIQFYIEALHRDISTTLYPWAYPAIGSIGGSSDFGLSCIPEINSYVWIFFDDEKFHRNAFYLGSLNLKQMGSHSLYEDNVKSTVGASSSYPNVKYIYLQNGICVAVSSDNSNPEITIFHPSANMFIDKRSSKRDEKSPRTARLLF